MNTDQTEELICEQLTEKVIGVFYDVYNVLGHGFLESVYHNAMVLALKQTGLEVESKPKIPVYFRGELVGDFEADIVVESKLLLELKAARELDPNAQLLARDADRSRPSDELRSEAEVPPTGLRERSQTSLTGFLYSRSSLSASVFV
jgi:GxxExxY protein